MAVSAFGPPSQLRGNFSKLRSARRTAPARSRSSLKLRVPERWNVPLQLVDDASALPASARHAATATIAATRLEIRLTSPCPSEFVRSAAARLAPRACRRDNASQGSREGSPPRAE